jgi:hypothetical protein
MLAAHSSLCSLSPFELLDDPILERIAFYLAADSFIGPPSELVPLLCISRTINESLRFRSDSHLYSQIFCYKFDSAAVLRRLSWGRTTVGCMAEELRKRSTTLSRIRHRNAENFPYLQEDLWTVYLMILENDCKNMAQLCFWAELPTWVATVIEHKCQVTPQHPLSWFNDIEGTSLALWLLWMNSDEGQPLICGLGCMVSHWHQRASGMKIPIHAINYPTGLSPSLYKDIECVSKSVACPWPPMV